MRTLTLLLLCVHAMPLAAARRAKPSLPSGLVIASIKVESHNVFDTDFPPENKALYRAANAIHIRTRDAVIERELLFAVGDRYDPALVAETERNLRGLSFVRRAEAEAKVNKDGTVDVVVRTYDSWTLEVVANFKRAGGVVNTKAGLSDHNLLGYGKTFSAVYSRDGTASSENVVWKDPQFLGKKHLEFSMSGASALESRRCAVSLSRPFYASVARAALGSSITYGEDNISTYSGETAVGTVHRRLGEAGINYGVAIATSTEYTRHLKFGVLARRADYHVIPGRSPGAIPDTEHLGFFQLGGDWEELDFIKARRVQKFTHDEDYNLGLGVFPALEWAPYVRAMTITGSRILPSITVRKAFSWSEQLLFLRTGYSSKYSNGGNGNRLASASATYFLHGLPRQTLALHSALDHGWHLDAAAPLTLGEASGLRGYGLSQFAGNRRFLFNVEDRIYVYDELFRLIDIGTVAFFDSGYVWPSARSVRLGDLKSSVGLGLRIAPTRSSANDPVRIDMAYALSDNGSRSRWSLSIQAGQAFGP